MRTTAAVLHEVGKPLEIEEVELDGPGEGEVLIRFTHAGLCHSDLHVVQGDIAGRLPMVLGHEGAGVVEDVGPGVTRVAPGDHVVCSFVPSCGACHWCATGQQAICDWGAGTMRGPLPGDHWVLHGARGRYGAMCMLGTFAGHGVVHQYSCVRVDPDLPGASAALVGCGVPTGWGAAVNAADVRPGDTVVVYGTGGIGVHAVQGARFAGARHVIAVDPVALKRDTALRLGATHAVGDAGEAERLAHELTRGVGATAAVVTVGTMQAEVVAQAFAAVGKAGTVVLVAMAGFTDTTVALPGTVATLWKKTIKGSLFGDCNPTTDIPRLLDLYREGRLHLDEVITATYALDDVNAGYEDLVAGRIVRGVIAHQH
ncbi:NDMA-dependent alcohol dehydrogenase [Actinomycetospora chlora]|uniref:NDMA-dependent alcohol dehydrogenase n=1 Tax=Actinomycetospora chlora TaxID=663608 RepID=A0ABP9BG39_9PSEU